MYLPIYPPYPYKMNLIFSALYKAAKKKAAKKKKKKKIQTSTRFLFRFQGELTNYLLLTT